MADPCAHSESEHHPVNVCEEIVHYPSEDYPCFCGGFRSGDTAAVCGQCGHAAAKHVNLRLCRPVSGDFCPCRTVIA